MALGASRTDVLRLVLYTAGRLIIVGVGLGVSVAVVLMRMVAAQLWEVGPGDPITIASAVLVVTVTGMAASYFPARRAMDVNPVAALAAE